MDLQSIVIHTQLGFAFLKILFNRPAHAATNRISTIFKYVLR
jgi:hypothetical protein